MKPLIKEAVCISQDLGDVTFVGAVAVMLHTGEQRQSQDLDFVVAKQITVDEFLDKGYKIDLQGKKFTPRNYKCVIPKVVRIRILYVYLPENAEDLPKASNLWKNLFGTVWNVNPHSIFDNLF